MKHPPAFVFGLCALLLVIGLGCVSDAVRNPTITPVEAMPGDDMSGGLATVHDATPEAFALPMPNLSKAQRRAFAVGNSFFNDSWVIAPASAEGRDGLGPLFNATNCSGCHLRDGRGRPPEVRGAPLESMLVRLSVPGPDGGDQPHPIYGDQLQDKAIPGVPAEAQVLIDWDEQPGRYADGTPFSLRQPRITLTSPGYGPLPADLRISARTAPSVFGVGLLEAVPEAALLALADPDDRDGDGISGRLRRVVEPRSGELRAGRFGWKGGAATVEQQTGKAFAGDLGITSTLEPSDHATAGQVLARAAPQGGTPELSDHKLQRVVEYLRMLAVPARRDRGDAQVLHGEGVFRALRCDACHTPELRTGLVADIASLGDQPIRSYSDLLLHDMGPGLADGRPEGAGPDGASGQEWRTPPLWGLGLLRIVNKHELLLHDGRARGAAEAILWHGGEAAAAAEAFRRLPAAERQALLRFLASL